MRRSTLTGIHHPASSTLLYPWLISDSRVPAIEDPNTKITLWESGAIIEYLIDTYDKSHELTYTTFPEKYQLKQWLYFQTSGQGPYFGQAAWFSNFHPEKLPSAIKRYKEQTLRVVDVLNRALEGKNYLVGDKCTYADLAFVPWDGMIPLIFKDEVESLQLEKKYPNYARWHKLCTDRKAVHKVLEEKKSKVAAK